MDTFRQSKKLATVSLMLGLFLGGSSAFAGNMSPLDPFNQTKPAGSGKQSSKREMLPEATGLSTTYVNVDGNENEAPKMPHIKKKFLGSKSDELTATKIEKIKAPREEKIKAPKEPKLADKPKTKSKSKDSSLAARSDDGIVGGTKAASAKLGDGMASSTKKVGDGLTSGAKASGSFFMKGAKAIGGGFKGSDDKDKTKVASAPVKKAKAQKELSEPKIAEDKRSPLDEPKKVSKKTDWEETDKSDKSKDKKKKGSGMLAPISNGFKDTLHAATDKLSLSKSGASKEKDSGTDQVAQQSTKMPHNKAKVAEPTYIANGKTVKKSKEKSKPKSESSGGLMSKTLGILPFVGGSKKSSEEPAKRQLAKSDNDELVTDSSPPKGNHKKEEETLLGPSL